MTPDLRVFQPTRASRGAVLVLPGGGYAGHADHEATDPAEWCRSRGATAAVLRYRVAPHRHPAPLEDARWALQRVRASFPGPVAVWGFSAGAHLAGLLATEPAPEARPDAVVLAYPVVSLIEPDGHYLSRDNLLGSEADPARFAELSVDRRVDTSTPPMFLMHTDADDLVDPMQSVRLYAALRRVGVPAELHVYERGAHGEGLGTPSSGTAGWPDLLAPWLGRRGITHPGRPPSRLG